MKSIIKALSLILLLFSFHDSNGQETPEQITKKFFDLYRQGDVVKSMEYLFTYSVDADQSNDNKTQFVNKQWNQVGRFYGEELLLKKDAGPNVIMYTYLVRHHVSPLLFRMLFYKANNHWQLQSFRSNFDINQELEEASKLQWNMGTIPAALR